jgi:acyl-CoA thioester hydrolase
MMSGGGIGPIVASVTCNYRRQLQYPDSVFVGTRVAEIRRASMILAHAVYSQSQRQLAADGQTVVVFFDYATNRPRPVPEDARDLLGNPKST